MTGTITEADVDLTLAELRHALRSHLADGAALTEVRAIAEGRADGFDRDRWVAISSALGVGALMVGQAQGGLGLDLRYAAAAAEVTGEMACPSPVRSTLLAARVITCAVDGSPSPSDHPAAAWLEAIADRAASAAVATDAGPHIRGQVTLDVGSDPVGGSACMITGSLAMVENGDDADHLVLWADHDTAAGGPAGGGALVGVALADPAATCTRLAATDSAGGFARIDLDRCPAVVLGDRTARDQAADLALVLRAAEQIGLARGALAMATEHARHREQFGRIIGSYQAISHRLAQTAVDIEGAAGLVAAACVAGAPAAAAWAPLAAASAARVSSDAADTLVQVLGGIGFTWEHDAQFYFRRIRSSAVWMGSADALDDLAAQRGCHRLLRS